MGAIDSFNIDHFLMNLDHVELRGKHETFDSFAYISKAASKELETFEFGLQDFDSLAFASRAAIQECAQKYIKYLGYCPVDIIRKTLENSTQLATSILHHTQRFEFGY